MLAARASDPTQCWRNDGPCDVHAQGFRQFLREVQSLGVRTLVTSRCQVDCELQGVEELRLDSLPAKQAADLLCHIVGAGHFTPPQAEQLETVCGNNALAVRLIGAFIQTKAVKAEVRHGHLVAVQRMSNMHLAQCRKTRRRAI